MTETIINTYPEDGICYPRMSLNIRNIPCASTGTILDQYNLGESVIYDQVVITNSYVWISWLSVSGRRVYMAIKDQATGERLGDCDDIPNSSVGAETIIQEYSESGICYPRMTMNIRDLPCASTGNIFDQYYQGEYVIYDYVVITNEYVWISWLSRSGARRYMAVKDQTTGERFGDCGDLPGGYGESNTPTGAETIVNEYSESGICYPQMTTSILNIPCSTNGVVLDYYYVGESVIYDYVVITNKYVWISWTSVSGRRVYMTVKDQVTGERWGNCEDLPGGSGNYSGIGMPGIQKIFIDAGHGGSDPGALGNGLKEKDVVLNIAQKLTGLFNSRGIQVSHSRYSDNNVGLAERAEMANEWGADLFISIHANALDGSGSAYGTECYTYPNSTDENKRLAVDIASSISSKLGTYNRGHKEADFAVLRLTSMPAVLVETAFIDNVGDASLLKNRQDDFANAIFTAVIGTENSTPDPSEPDITLDEINNFGFAKDLGVSFTQINQQLSLGQYGPIRIKLSNTSSGKAEGKVVANFTDGKFVGGSFKDEISKLFTSLSKNGISISTQLGKLGNDSFSISVSDNTKTFTVSLTKTLSKNNTSINQILSFEFDKDSLEDAYEAVINFIEDLTDVLKEILGPIILLVAIVLFWKLGLIETLISSGIIFLGKIGLALYKIIEYLITQLNKVI